MPTDFIILERVGGDHWTQHMIYAPLQLHNLTPNSTLKPLSSQTGKQGQVAYKPSNKVTVIDYNHSKTLHNISRVTFKFD